VDAILALIPAAPGDWIVLLAPIASSK